MTELIPHNERERRLFVPLATGPFRWFESGGKRWELRRYGRQYTERQLVPGRRVELRRGYKSVEPSLWGSLVQVVRAATLRGFFRKVPFNEVVPTARDLDDAIDMATAILRIAPDAPVGVIGFRVQLDE